MGKRLIHPNQETILELPYSEVCMHLRVAGTRMRARLQPDGMVQLLDPDGRDFSFPITAAEAGLHHDQDGWSSWSPTRPTRSPTRPPARITGRSWMRSASRWPSPIATAGVVR